MDGFNYQFNNWTDLEHLHDTLLSNTTHLASEALVITLSAIANHGIPTPIVISPICNHSNDEFVRESIKEIIRSFTNLNPESNIVNVATDGDSSRRKTLNSLRCIQTEFKSLVNLKLFDQNLLFGRYGINFDAKHLVKRLRSLIISEKRDCKLINLNINRFHVADLLNDCPEAKPLMNVKDKQNVPSAVQLLMLIRKKTENLEGVSH